MHTTLFDSISVNGMMGRPDGRGDFFTDHCWHGFVQVARATGAMIWGRRTHDVARGLGGALAQLSGIRGVVLTSRRDYAVEPGWQVAASPREALDRLAAAGASGTLVAGGQTVNTAFLSQGLLDEVMLFVESVLIPRGMPLFAPTDAPDVRLELMEVARPTDSVLSLRYRVVR